MATHATKQTVPTAKAPSTTTATNCFALLGSGRMARHLQFYFASLNLRVNYWSRNGESRFNSASGGDAQERLAETLAEATHVLFAVRDDAIQELGASIRRNACHHEKRCVHFSGALNIPGIIAAHPLMTFGAELADASWYPTIPFIVDKGHALHDLLPGLPNPAWTISPQKRTLYHALCSLAGNASFLMWEQIGAEFENALELPRHLLAPFLHKVVDNATKSAQRGDFTGPVARGDWQTVLEHLRALDGSRPELRKAYHSYLHLADGLGHPIPEGLL